MKLTTHPYPRPRLGTKHLRPCAFVCQSHDCTAARGSQHCCLPDQRYGSAAARWPALRRSLALIWHTEQAGRQKAAISFTVRPSVLTEQLGSRWADFDKNLIFRIVFTKIWRRNRRSVKTGQKQQTDTLNRDIRTPRLVFTIETGGVLCAVRTQSIIAQARTNRRDGTQALHYDILQHGLSVTTCAGTPETLALPQEFKILGKWQRELQTHRNLLYFVPTPTPHPDMQTAGRQAGRQAGI